MSRTDIQLILVVIVTLAAIWAIAVAETGYWWPGHKTDLKRRQESEGRMRR